MHAVTPPTPAHEAVRQTAEQLLRLADRKPVVLATALAELAHEFDPVVQMPQACCRRMAQLAAQHSAHAPRRPLHRGALTKRPRRR